MELERHDVCMIQCSRDSLGVRKDHLYSMICCQLFIPLVLTAIELSVRPFDVGDVDGLDVWEEMATELQEGMWFFPTS